MLVLNECLLVFMYSRACWSELLITYGGFREMSIGVLGFFFHKDENQKFVMWQDVSSQLVCNAQVACSPLLDSS